MTSEQLKNLQCLGLEDKVMLTKARIKEFVSKFGSDRCYISFSGGKDSTVLLDIVRSIYPDMKAVYIDTGLEFPEIKEFVKSMENVEVIEEYGYPVISKEIALTVEYARKGSKWAIDRLEGNHEYGNHAKYKWLLNEPYKVSSRCCDIMKKEPAKRYEKESGRHPIIGTMASEGGQRRSAYLRTGCQCI